MKVAVIGAGVAGFAAAVTARRAGAEVEVIAHGAGASELAGGTWDIAPEPSTRQRPALSDRLREFARSHPYHPYARMAGDLGEQVRAAHDALLPELGLYRPLDRGALVATDLGLLRGASIAANAVLDLTPLSEVTVVELANLDAYRARFVASSLTAQDSGVRYTPLRIAPFGEARSSHALPIARLLDEGIEGLSNALAAHPSPAYLLPTVLGISKLDVAQALAARLGAQVGEVHSPLASAQGARLRAAIDRALERHGVSRAFATVRSADPKTLHLALDDGSSRAPDAIVLATGRYVAGGLVVRDGHFVEPVAGAAIYENERAMQSPSSLRGPDPRALFGDDPFTSSAGSRTGVGYDPQLRVLDCDGRPVHERLFAAGALLSGHDPTRDGTGLGCALTTGWLAGRAAAQ